jgi:folylpolyglutamate synthase/dihydropteroate synthase
MHLTDLDRQITALLTSPGLKIDDYTRAHLLDSQERIRKVLSAQVQVQSID